MKYDIVIIGAGPAGAFAAQRLSQKGHKVLIIDRGDKKKICAGILTAQYARKYRIEDVYIERILKGIRLSFKGLKAEINYKHAVEYSINRGLFDSFNLQEAIAAGSDFKKDKILSIEETDSSLIIRSEKVQIISDYAIVAAGVSELSRHCGGSTSYAYCVQQKKDIKPDDYFEMELQIGGYSWISPKKDHVLSGTSSLKDYPDVPGHRCLIPLGPVKKTFSGRSVLAGDAAGFVSPLEGEGLYYARRSGEIAAEIISGTISGGNTLADYENSWKKEFDFSTLKLLSGLLSTDRSLELFVKLTRDNERFNNLVEGILTKENKDLYSLINKLR